MNDDHGEDDYGDDDGEHVKMMVKMTPKQRLVKNVRDGLCATE